MEMRQVVVKLASVFAAISCLAALVTVSSASENQPVEREADVFVRGSGTRSHGTDKDVRQKADENDEDHAVWGFVEVFGWQSAKDRSSKFERNKGTRDDRSEKSRDNDKTNKKDGSDKKRNDKEGKENDEESDRASKDEGDQDSSADTEYPSADKAEQEGPDPKSDDPIDEGDGKEPVRDHAIDEEEDTDTVPDHAIDEEEIGNKSNERSRGKKTRNKNEKERKRNRWSNKKDRNGNFPDPNDEENGHGNDNGKGDGILPWGDWGDWTSPWREFLRPCEFLDKYFSLPIRCELDLLSNFLSDRTMKLSVDLNDPLCAPNQLGDGNVCASVEYNVGVDLDDFILASSVRFEGIVVNDIPRASLGFELATCFNFDSAGVPTMSPTMSAEPSSSQAPSQAPTTKPSTQPTLVPSKAPSKAPSSVPSRGPTLEPSTTPSLAPSEVPSISLRPTSSMVPSIEPTGTARPTDTTQPSSTPSAAPSSAPSAIPSSQPSAVPSTAPSVAPSTAPSAQPSQEPSKSPTTESTEFAESVLGSRPSISFKFCSCAVEFAGVRCQFCEVCPGGGITFDCSNVASLFPDVSTCEKIGVIDRLDDEGLGEGQLFRPVVPDFLRRFPLPEA